MEKFKVNKEYCGIGKDSEVESNNPATIRHMEKEGYWKKVEPTKRKKKIEPIKKRLKK